MLMSFPFQAIAPGDHLQFAADGFFDGDDRAHLEHERGEHRTEFVNGHQVIAFHQHVPAPLADPDHEEVDLEVARRLPLAEHIQDPLLRVLVFHWRTLLALEPADHVFHGRPFRSLSVARPGYLLITDVAGRGLVIGSAWRCTSFQLPLSSRNTLVTRTATGTVSSAPPTLARPRSTSTKQARPSATYFAMSSTSATSPSR